MPNTSLVRTIKRVMAKQVETKYFDWGLLNANLYHDVGYGITLGGTVQGAVYFNQLVGITKGTNRSNRIGDKINLSGIKFKFWLANKSSRPNCLYRIIICILPKYYNGQATTSTNIDLFEASNSGSGSAPSTITGIVAKDKGIRTLYDRVHSVEIGYSDVAGVGSKECHRLVQVYIRRNGKPILFDDNNAVINNPIAAYVIPYDSYGTLQTDNIASCEVFARHYYKDA